MLVLSWPSSSATSVPAVLDGVCQGWESPAQHFPHPKGSTDLSSAGSARVVWIIWGAAEPHPPVGWANPCGSIPWAPALASPSWVWKGRFQAVPSRADGTGVVLPWHKVALKGCQRASRKQEVLPKKKVSSAQKENEFWRKTRNCSSQSCEKPWQNIEHGEPENACQLLDPS